MCVTQYKVVRRTIFQVLLWSFLNRINFSHNLKDNAWNVHEIRCGGGYFCTMETLQSLIVMTSKKLQLTAKTKSISENIDLF